MSLEHAPQRDGLRIVRPRQLAEMLGVSKSTLFSWIRTGRLPAPLALGPRVRGWREADIADHLARCARPVRSQLHEERAAERAP